MPADIISLEERKAQRAAALAGESWSPEDWCDIVCAIREQHLLVGIDDKILIELEPEEAIQFASDLLLKALHLQDRREKRGKEGKIP